jgi:hypothetical protein
MRRPPNAIALDANMIVPAYASARKERQTGTKFAVRMMWVATTVTLADLQVALARAGS